MGTSVTFMPHFYNIDDLILCDCPGFDDNRSGEINIGNSSSIFTIIKNAKSIKFVIVQDFGAIANRCSDVVNVLKILDNMFGGNVGLSEVKAHFLWLFSKFPSNLPYDFTKDKLVQLVQTYNLEDFFRDIPYDRIIIYDPLNRYTNALTKDKIICHLREMEGYNPRDHEVLFKICTTISGGGMHPLPSKPKN